MRPNIRKEKDLLASSEVLWYAKYFCFMLISTQELTMDTIELLHIIQIVS